MAPYDYDRRVVAARPKVPVDEDGQKLMAILEKQGKARAWMSTIRVVALEAIKRPGNEGMSLDDAYEFILEEWLPRVDHDIVRYARKALELFEKNRGFERTWYAKVKRDKATLTVLRGPLGINEFDLQIYEIVKAKGMDKWMSEVLDNAYFNASENGQREEWDPKNEGMTEGYYMDDLGDIFGRELGSHAGDRMRKFVRSPSFEAIWYAAMASME